MNKLLTKVTSGRKPADMTPGKRCDRIFIRDLNVPFSIGVNPEEKDAPQNVRINVELFVATGQAGTSDEISDTVDYSLIVKGIRRLAEQGHINLVETLAEKVADLCLSDGRVLKTRIRIEKTDAFSEAESVGIEIER